MAKPKKKKPLKPAKPLSDAQKAKFKAKLAEAQKGLDSLSASVKALHDHAKLSSFCEDFMGAKGRRKK
jgi:hypothetical protein